MRWRRGRIRRGRFGGEEDVDDDERAEEDVLDMER
jgi:hypothetical protein